MTTKNKTRLKISEVIELNTEIPEVKTEAVASPKNPKMIDNTKTTATITTTEMNMIPIQNKMYPPTPIIEIILNNSLIEKAALKESSFAAI